jgi:hypothetical protein
MKKEGVPGWLNLPSATVIPRKKKVGGGAQLVAVMLTVTWENVAPGLNVMR